MSRYFFVRGRCRAHAISIGLRRRCSLIDRDDAFAGFLPDLFDELAQRSQQRIQMWITQRYALDTNDVVNEVSEHDHEAGDRRNPPRRGDVIPAL